MRVPRPLPTGSLPQLPPQVPVTGGPLLTGRFIDNLWSLSLSRRRIRALGHSDPSVTMEPPCQAFLLLSGYMGVRGHDFGWAETVASLSICPSVILSLWVTPHGYLLKLS